MNATKLVLLLTQSSFNGMRYPDERTMANASVYGIIDHDNISQFNDSHFNNSLGQLSGVFGGPKHYGLIHLCATSIFLGLMILLTIIGNVFVVAAIILERNLQSVANYLVMSLAVTDLMVATLVMPISAVDEVTTQWFLGPEVCDMWISFDVLCCTASILHLVVIALDRYWAITRVEYMHQRTAKRVILMIAAVWTVSICISIPPLFGWKDKNHSPYITGQCIISQDRGYTVFSTFGAFYVPLFFMMVINAKILKAARSIIRKKSFNKGHGSTGFSAPRPTEIAKEITDGRALTQISSSGNSESPDRPTNGSMAMHLNDANRNNTFTSKNDILNETSLLAPDSPSGNHVHVNHNSEKVTYIPKTNSNSLAPPSRSRLLWRKKLKGGAENRGPKVIKPPKPPRIEREKVHREHTNKEKMEQRRERKAARTLAIITGVFVVCWVPFFTIALFGPFCLPMCVIPDLLRSLVLWLGYSNSLLNPVIYTIFNPDFRNAFRKILFGKFRNRNRQRGR